jgi:hypothetical protein
LSEYYAIAAVRHFLDAEKLAIAKSFDSAGHLVGFAAECAIKHCIEELRPANEAPHIHFPLLVEKAKRLLHGRSKHPLFTLLQRSAFMAGCRIEHRYADNGTVTEQNYLTWRGDASRALGAAQLRGSR